MLKRDPGRFNYAIIDEKLRDGEGLALAATIKAMDCGKDLRLALFCHAKLRERMGSDERIDGFISKPLMSGRFSEQFLAAFKQGEGVSTFGSDEVDPHLGSKIPLAILVAEDNPVNLKLILGILGRMGYGADHALNGKLAVDAARSRKYDLVLMDCQMPEMDGIEATKIILNELPEASRPDAVIALTAHAIEEYKSKCLDAGMKDFLVKPVNSVRIQETIRRFFGQRQAGGDKTPPAKGKPDGAPHASEDAEIPLVDYTPLREHAQIRDSFLKELVEIFEEDAPKSIASVRDNVARGNLKAAGDAAHGLKGSAASLGLRRLAEVSLRLQKAGRDGAAAEIPGLLLELDSAFKESLSALKTAVSEICSGGAS
jgi:CheY-like chemotaxis protein/HPt (histidine-containing phosphotransfer) domain-containing protein